jgi:hypothetical protein
MNNNQTNDQVMNGVKMLAAASATPFRTAFKITMGIAMAQLLTLALVLGGFAALIFFAALFIGGK